MPRTVIAGGGIAGLEALVALRRHLGSAPSIDLIEASDELAYDALLVAVGARADVAVPGALTFSGPRDVGAFRRLLDDLVAGRVRAVAFAVPPCVAWALPLYELALMTAEHLRGARVEG